ncbi:tetratricopeptide repeat protein [Aquisphaera insulae]|uniref:tetratricopeptide repeat protein n=1 Tax=Aquisphaera insulae TaxID=2712864 RepID=UPI0013ECC4F6|nr:tetratricopeptide repeat protein [Aquisphaera insulae]
MKNEPAHAAGTTKTIPARHQFEHETPTQIHHSEEEMMILARWTKHALENPTRFWGTIAAIVIGLLVLVVGASVLSGGSSASSEVWSKLEAAKSPADKVKIAEDFPQSPASLWARLEAASDYYNQGVLDLPNNKDVALPTLKKALDNFSEVAKDAPKDSPQAKTAALGKARALEARNELSKAIEQYQLVAKTWPESPEGIRAKDLAAELQKPETVAFYKELYAYVPPKVTLPPMGSQNLDLPLMPSPAGLPESNSTGTGTTPFAPFVPPPPPADVEKKADAAKPAVEATSGPAQAIPELPFDPAAKPKAGAPVPTPAPDPTKPPVPVEKPKS